NPEKEQSAYINIIIKELTLFDEKYENAKIEVWLPNQLKNFFNSFLSLALKVKGIESLHFQPHESWSRNGDMQKNFERGEAQDKFISTLQAALRQSDTAVHIHIG